jgi:hypothetical protein
MTHTAITAGAPLPVILRAVRRDGWGDLAGAHNRSLRGALAALADLLPATTAAGDVTVWEIAQASSYSERWTRVALGRLEALGLITWERGTIVQGRPTPSWVRLSKRLLVELQRAARRLRVARDQAHNADRVARLARLRQATLPAHKQKARSDRAALGAGPRPLRGEARAAVALPAATATPEPSTNAARAGHVARARLLLAQARTQVAAQT